MAGGGTTNSRASTAFQPLNLGIEQATVVKGTDDMQSGREFGAGRRGSGPTKKNAFCSFCRKSYRDVGPLVEGSGDVYICGDCIELCQQILDQERKRRGVPKTLFT